MMTIAKSERMSGAQYQKALVDLGFTARDAGAAELLGVDERTSRRWANDERDIPGPVARLLRYLLATGKSGKYAIKKLETVK